jgi:esterase/lipase superfamily enzyme
MDREWEVVMYGHFGQVLLMFPTAGADYLEYERFHLIDAISPYIIEGKIKVFSINSINNESWLSDRTSPGHKSFLHKKYNDYVTDEVVPFIISTSSKDTPVITTGASFGALHAANTFFRRPDLFKGTIAMSGTYDLKSYTKGYYDDNVYFNSPVDYLSNLEDENILMRLRNNSSIYITCGQGSYEDPQASRDLSHVLNIKEIPHTLDVWGFDIPHDWPSWKKMLPYYIERHLYDTVNLTG